MIKSSQSAEDGFTLLELLVSMTLAVVILSLCVSFAPSLYKKNKLRVFTDEVKGAIQYAKIQALITGEPLILTRLPGVSDWSDGAILFVDNARHQYASETNLLHEWQWTSSGVHLSWRGFQSDDYLLFTPDMSSSAVNGTFIITAPLHQKTTLVVNRLGRVKENI